VSGLSTLHVVPSVASRYGGASVAVVGMCRALPAVGVDATIASTDADGPLRLHSRVGEVEVREDVPTILFPLGWSEGFKYCRPLAAWLLDHVVDYDVIHIHAIFSHSSLAAAAACQARNVPYVVSPHGMLDPWSMRRGWLKKRLLWYAGVHRMMRHAAAIHYTTVAERCLAEGSLGLRRGVVVPLGVDGILLEDASTADSAGLDLPRPYILALARLDPKKGLDLLLQAFGSLQWEKQATPWTLVLAGDGNPAYKNRLKSLANRLGLGNRVRFTGWIEGARKRSILRAAALFALPSHQENFGISVVEAMACGVPVLVSSSVNLASEIAEAGAGWITSLEADDLAARLEEAMQLPEERERRGAAGSALVRGRFTWPTVANGLADMYNAVTRTGLVLS